MGQWPSGEIHQSREPVSARSSYGIASSMARPRLPMTIGCLLQSKLARVFVGGLARQLVGIGAALARDVDIGDVAGGIEPRHHHHPDRRRPSVLAGWPTSERNQRWMVANGAPLDVRHSSVSWTRLNGEN